jgi:hypothetical protein
VFNICLVPFNNTYYINASNVPQSSLFERLKENEVGRKGILQVDYAENFAMGQQDAIQAAHWNTKALSIVTSHA